ncbi:MAG TPA: isocyanide synthase family protein [Pyrinomonadaceae bacterium]|jgi:pyoverdine/dityrosine biosynthesis protein Dit1
MSPLNFSSDNSERRLRQRLIEAAAARLACGELSRDFLQEVIAEVNCSAERAGAFFRNSADLIFALYARFAGDLEARVAELPDDILSERFYALMKIKFALMKPYEKALGGLAETLAHRQGELGILSPQTEIIRLRVQAVLSATVQGATDYRGSSADSISRNLYTTYLGLMWLWYKDNSEKKQKAHAALKLVRKTLSFAAPVLNLSQFELPLKAFDKIQQSLLLPKEDSVVAERATGILLSLFKHRRLLPDFDSCEKTPCAQCRALHLPKIKYFIAANRPIHLILPAFPAKSPNPRKTLGILPDKAEEQALLYLEKVCAELCRRHAPGVRLTICSDGHVFSDLVGVSDNDVTLYGQKIREMLARLNDARVIDTFGLTDLYENIDYPAMRRHLVKEYAQPIEEIRQKASEFMQTGALVNGIHRFLFEDEVVRQPERSRTKIRQDCRELAYCVVQRSDAWGRLLADCFPFALRLSIHPQHPHSDKIGILLGPANDVWLTPWHAVAVEQNGRFKLMRRHEAESLGAYRVEENGRPSHYRLDTDE